ncbi:MAG: hypothetical protein AB1813_25410 [Verrucomicrobiota bacterium]
MKPNHLRHAHEENQNLTQTTASAQQNGQEFQTAEDLLRYDSNLHPVPAKVPERLSESLSAEPKPGLPWWRKFFSRDA